MEVTFERVLTEARQLPLPERKMLGAILTSELVTQEASKSLEQIALEQGKHPLSLEELLGPTPDPDDDDDVDEFLGQLREWRSAEVTREWATQE